MPDTSSSLDQLHDIVQPDPVSWWPPAPFWYCLIALAASWVTCVLLVGVCRWIQNAYRRQAIRELQLVQIDDTLWPTKVSRILKRVALVSFPREQVASLSGEPWLRFLTDTCDKVDFLAEPNRCIGFASFDPHGEAGAAADRTRIAHDARTWIVDHRAEPRR